MNDTYILFKDWTGYYFLTTEENYNNRIINKLTILELKTKDRSTALKIFENNFKGYKLIIKE